MLLIFSLLLMLALFSRDSDAQELRQFAVADLTAARADAEAHQDATAVQCYAALLEQARTPVAAPVGIVSAFQRARDVHRATQSEALQTACGPLAVEAVLGLRQLPQVVIWPPLR
ncbi:MAG TPA: hypothetical protein PLO14_03265 [Accumulibacter sp.]|uniref:hypothetical protein n=1 Tax=Accumulibacter sp. TaxID=2053492 RepID=UPI0025FBFE8E|nr:hypothetical protein [Accumulibacter sp.]MCM8599914.1 hypothetical protein [Accumulibacter sp.]MCM8664098.1 hypothetical protein [Accumulibacter sp.]HNC51248.1 hypothetical protein [Accumulibacter sp.]